MKKIKFSVLALLAAVAGMTFGSCNNDDSKDDGGGQETENKEITSSADTIWVDYNGQVNLADYLDANFTFTLTNDMITLYQPSYRLTQNNVAGSFTRHDVYELNGTTLSCKASVRVEDAFDRTEAVPGSDPVTYYTYARREVTEGSVRITVDDLVTEVVIAQKNKPALVPTISVKSNAQYGAGPTLELSTTGAPTILSGSIFNISPIDFDPNRVLVQPGNVGAYLHTNVAGAVVAGGKDSEAGNGGYIVGFYVPAQGAGESQGDYDARVTAARQAAIADNNADNKLYVNVTYVAPNQIVGIVLNETVIGRTAQTAFWRNNANGRQVPQSFVLAKLNDDSTVPYNPGEHGEVIAGDFNSYLEGRTTKYTIESTDWWSHIALKLAFTDLDVDCPVGTALTFKVTHKDHFNDPNWTVTVNTRRVSANPTTLSADQLDDELSGNVD